MARRRFIVQSASKSIGMFTADAMDDKSWTTYFPISRFVVDSPDKEKKNKTKYQ